MSSYAATVFVTNVGNAYTPPTITITEGDDVQFNITNNHNVVEVSLATFNANGTASNGGFSTPFGGGNVAGLTPGTYYYICTPHAFLGMKGTINVNAAPPPSGCDLLISGVFDGPLSGGIPKLLELAVLNNIPDLSVYGLSSVTNGAGATGTPEFTFPAVSASAGEYIYIATESASVNTYFGFLPDYTDNFINVNGDDAIELFLNGSIIDVFGDVATDGTGEAWEYLDGWAYRNDGVSCSPTFDFTDWTFSGVNSNDGQTLNSADPIPFPLGTFELIASPKINVSSSSFTMNEGDATTIITNLVVSPTLANITSVEIHLIGGSGSAADLDLTLFGGGPFPLTIPINANSGTLTVPITPFDDAVFEGTETFNFVLRNATGGLSLGNDSTFLLTLTDNELPPDTTINVNPTSVTVNEGDGTATLSFEIGQLSVSTTTFTVDLQLASGDAADVDGYTTETISFPSSGTATQTVTITLTDDAIVEGTEILTFELVNPSAGLTLGANITASLVINDNDLATSTLASVTAVDALGVPTETGNAFVLYGVVNSPDRGFNSLEFSFQDASGAITAFENGTALTYNAIVGDSVEVTGTIGSRFGVTVVTSLTSINLLSSNASVTPTLEALPTEANESSLIRVNGLQLVNPAQWTSGSGAAGFDVNVFTASNDTFIVRIDRDYAALYSTTDIPCGVFDVIGVAGQYDIATPFTDNYQLLPRFLTDVIDTCATVAPSMTIAALTEVDPITGDPLMLGTVATVKGIITSPDFRALQGEGTEFTFSDGTGGVWAYSTDSSISFNPVVGDSVEVTGNIGVASGVTRLFIDVVTSLGSATPFTPTIVTGALGEAQEAELIQINGLRLNGTWNSSGPSYNVSATAAGITYEIRVDADRLELFSVPLSSTNTFNLTGIGTQFDPTAPRTEGYQILPRFDSDIEIASGLNDLELANFSVSPIPAQDILNFSFDYTTNETITVAVLDILGKEVATQQVTLVKGMNVNSISVAELNTGFYVFQIKTANGTKNTNILVK